MPPLVSKTQRSSGHPSRKFSPALIIPVLLTGLIAGTTMTAYRLSRTAMARMKTERPEIVVEFEEALLQMTAARLQDGNRLLRELVD